MFQFAIDLIQFVCIGILTFYIWLADRRSNGGHRYPCGAENCLTCRTIRKQ